jgi:hypothetical protein
LWQPLKSPEFSGKTYAAGPRNRLPTANFWKIGHCLSSDQAVVRQGDQAGVSLT